MRQSSMELGVGVFILLGIICVGYLTFRLGEVEFLEGKYYFLNARFTSVAGLQVGASVDIAGVHVGLVDAINLNPRDLVVIVRLKVREGIRVSEDAIASIKTEGLLGDKYIQISPGGSDRYLKPGDMIVDTEPAIDIVGLIGKYALGQVDKAPTNPTK
jgi:phospholipid/cholesterol/gamma-HCH transport system substrate-binding protein